MRLTKPILFPFAAIVLAMLPAVLDQTILATALPTIATDLGRLADVSWVVTAYVVSAAAATPLWGKLGDRHGRKRLLEASLAIFLAASALCGVAQNLPMLIVARAVQGAAAGGLMTLAYAAVGDLVSPRERGRYQGYIAATFAGAAAIGPLLGGLLVQHASWRWVFYVNLPIGLLALAGLRLRLPAPDTQSPKTALDVTGSALLASATAALMLVCIWGGQRYRWGSPEIIGLLGVLAASALALVGLGFGMVSQVLIIAVQNGVERRELGVAMAVTSFFRALGGAVGAAILGAIFAARVGTAGTGTIAVKAAGRADVISAVHT